MTLSPSTFRSNTLRRKLLTVGRVRSLRTKTFDFDEVRQAHWLIESDWAFARTRSTGTVKVLASDQASIPEANQELFVLHREDDGQWRFVRYIFSTTNPPTQR